MSLSLHWFLRASLSLLTLHYGETSVMTEVQLGPLYRVIDYPLSIYCNVSGFVQADIRKEFQFRMFMPDQPSREINLISTNDADFSFAIYSRRVRSREIVAEHVSPNSVVLKINNLKETDEGEYECSVINHEIKYHGTYSAKTSVHVIDNSLIISSPDPASLSCDEGGTLSLTCHASSNTVQHTHLSITWYLHKDEEGSAHPIISLDMDFTLSPGPAFEERYRAGLIGLDKVGETTYRLKLSQVMLSDQGKIYCRVQEWIQDPDRSWFSLAQKETEPTFLNVKAKELPDKGSVGARISVQNATLQEGQELSVSCDVDTQNLAGRLFSVAWLRDDVELARIGPTGVLSVGSEYSVRESGGELRAMRTSERGHRMILRPIRTQDQGEYLCRVWPQERGTDGLFTQGAAQDSRPQAVTISATEGGLSVEMEKNLNVKEGDKLHLTCKVSGGNGLLSVTWQHRSPSATSSFSNIISLSQEGVMAIGMGFGQRSIRAMRPAADTFTFELDGVTPADAGNYQCTVSVNTNDDIHKTHSQSEVSTVEVIPIESLVQVDLKSRTTMVTVGEDVEMMCRVRGSHLPVTVKWNLQRERAASQDNILTLFPSGDITWRGDHRRYQMKTTIPNSTPQDHTYILLINGASIREAGRYQCEVSVFLEKSHKRLKMSNLLGVTVKNPVSQLSLASSPSVEGDINTDIAIKCSVVKPTSLFSRFAVTWCVQREADNQTVVSSNRDGVVTFGPGVELSSGQRISMQRTGGLNFELNIRQARIGDSGSYYCEVVEWLQDPRGEWYELPPVRETTKLKIIEPEINLSVGKMDIVLNVTGSQEFTVPCNITAWSSKQSAFQVTWFWGRETENEQHPIFTVYQNSTLQDSSGRGERLRFGHPVARHYRITLFNAIPADSGLYFCEVEEWLLSPSKDWKRVAVERSGQLTVNVYTDAGDTEAVSGSRCPSHITLGVLLCVVICLMVVVFILVGKICRGQSPGAKKPASSLWAEEHHLQAKPIED